MGREGVWGGREYGTREYAKGHWQGRRGGWGGREAGAKGSIGRKAAYCGRQPTAEVSMGFDPQATTFLSPPEALFTFGSHHDRKLTRGGAVLGSPTLNSRGTVIRRDQSVVEKDAAT